MAKYRLKQKEVEARQIDHRLVVIHDEKGELRAEPTDWLVGTERGKIDIVKDDDFQEQYELIDDKDDHVEAEEGGLDVTDSLHVDSTGDNEHPEQTHAFPSDVEPILSAPEREGEQKE